MKYKHSIVSVLILSLMYLGIHYLIFSDDQNKWGPLAIALVWGILFHFFAKKYLSSSYIFSKGSVEKE